MPRRLHRRLPALEEPASFVEAVRARAPRDAHAAEEAYLWLVDFARTLPEAERGSMGTSEFWSAPAALGERFAAWARARFTHDLIPRPRFSDYDGVGVAPERWWDQHYRPYFSHAGVGPRAILVSRGTPPPPPPPAP